MATFKQVPQTFLFRKLLGVWGNVVKNYDGACQDDRFFAVIRNCFDYKKGIELLSDAFTVDELKDVAEDRRGGGAFAGSLNDIFQVIWNYERGRERCRIVLDAIRSYLVRECGMEKEDRLERRFEELKRVLKLSDLEGEIAILAYLRNETCFAWPCRVGLREKPLYYAMALDRSYDEVVGALTEKGRLRRLGVLDSRLDFSRPLGSYLNGRDEGPVARRFYRERDLERALPWTYFGELVSQDGGTLKWMVSSCTGHCNILLYGVPGTGKTSFASSLCKEVGRRAFDVRQEEGEGFNHVGRKIGILVANEQVDPADSLLIVDEADELLRGDSDGFGRFGIGMKRVSEKCEMDMLLDDMRVPTIWISNVPAEEMEESVRRRFDFSICFERLNAAQRNTVWRNQVERLELGDLISETKLSDYAAKYETSAGGVAVVLENVKRMNPSPEAVDGLVNKLMKTHCRLMGIKVEGRFLSEDGYSLAGLNIRGKVGLEKIESSIRNYLDGTSNEAGGIRPRMNLLLFGPPGTGKTEFVRHLGRVLDRKVLVRKTSDILDKYVGETEKQIAASFRQAEAEHAILFFDEVDGLVQDRKGASQSWQIPQVDEFLQQMEGFDGVMIAATNLCQDLDIAMMRRFTFKLEFDYLDDAGKKLFFERMFKSTLTADEFADLKKLRNLTPGDFRTVQQELFYLGGTSTNLDRIEALEKECALKKDGRTHLQRIGFAD